MGIFRKIIFRSLVIFLLLSYAGPTNGQNPGLIFKYITSQNGLTDDDIRYIYQDKDGFMWISSLGGLDKYDGRNFYRYYNAMSDSTLNSLQCFPWIIEDSYNHLWVINDTLGIVVMNKDSEDVFRLKYDKDNPHSLSSNLTQCILEDSHKNIWVTTFGGGLCLFNRKDSSFIRFQKDPKNPESIGSNILTSIVEDKNGILWIASLEGLLIRLDPVSKTFTNIRITSQAEFFFPNVINPLICIDAENNLWFAIQQKLFKYNPVKKSVKEFKITLLEGTSKVFSFISSIVEMDDLHLLISTNNKGLYVFNKQNGNTDHYFYNVSNPIGICSDHLSVIYKSTDGVIWIGSNDNGISIYSKNALRFPQLMNIVNTNSLQNANNSTYCFSEFQDGRILMGTENKGLFIYNPGDNTISSFLTELENCSIYDLFTDRQNKLWICTWLNGLYTYDISTGKLDHVTRFEGLRQPVKIIKAAKILKDSKNRLWMGGITEGILVYDFNTKTAKRFFHIPGDSTSLVSNFIFRLFEDNHGNIWIGTSSGLHLYNEAKNNFVRCKLRDENGRILKNLLIYDIYQDTKNRLWIGSAKTLHLFHEKTSSFQPFPHIFRGDFLSVTRIFEDNSHILWLATNAGISMFKPETEEYTDYGMIDGIHYLSYNPNAGIKARNGYIYFGSRRGATVFNPMMIREDTIKPPVYITSFSVNDVNVGLHGSANLITRPIHKTDFIRLNYKQSTLAIRFASLNYSNPEANQYAYMLEGYDKDWIKAGNSNRALYTNLPPGKYVFHVIASNSHNFWNTTGDQLVIYIKSPFWRTYWFRIGAGLLLMLIIWLVYYNRIKSLKINKEKLEKIVKERTRELNTANVALTEQHEKLLQQNEEISSQNELLSQMSEEILKQNAELELHRFNLENLVEERTKEVAVALRKAEESDRLKSAFLANMSHEIRTPMNAIVGFANLLKDDEIDPEEKIEFIEVINANSEILLVLIDDILDLSLIEADQLTIKREIFGLNEMLDHLFSSYSLMNKKTNLQIKLNNELHASNLKIYSDKIRIKQILSNLMNNAYKFTDEGNIEIGLTRKDGQIVFYVKDTGIGISENDVDKIFDRFRKSNNSNNTLYRGTGLGLAICKALTSLLDGTLHVESVPQKGSTFFLSLPDSIITDEKEIINAATVHKDLANLTDKNILIVEDEQANYLYAKKLLGKLDVNIYWAENGMEAIRMLQSNVHFHLILMDIKMPVMDGFEATKIIKGNNKNQAIVALTAYARPEDRIHFMQAGFDEYLSKPIRPNDFLGVVRRYL